MNAAAAIRCLLVMLVLAGVAASSGAAAELQSIAAVTSLSLEELAREPIVRVRGIVTWSQPYEVVLQDGDRGLYVNIYLAIKRGIATGDDFPRDMPPGTVVEVEGRLIRGGFSPPLLPHELSIVGTAPLPAPQPFDAADFFTAASLHAIVEVDAVAQGVAREVTAPPVSGGQASVAMWMETQGRPFLAKISRRLLDGDPAEVLDAEVRLTGVVLPRFNTRGEADMPVVIVEHPGSFAITSQPPQPPFEAPQVPLRGLNAFVVRPPHGHRVRVEGTLIHAVPGDSIILQDGATGVRVMTSSTLPLVPGDRIEAAGFIDLSGRVAGLHNAELRRLGPGQPPAPIRITADDVVAVNRASTTTAITATPGDYENCLIEFPGRLLEKHATRDGGIFVVAAGATAVTARLSAADFRATRPILPGSEILLAGIGHTEWEPGRERWLQNPLDALVVDVRSAADVRLVRPPPWWTPRRLAIAAAGLASLAAIAVAWALALRREVRRQTALAVEEAAGRREAAVEYEVTLRERNHLAANLHDTVLQTVSGIGFQLKVCETANDRRDEGAAAAGPVRMAEHLAVARKMVDHAAGQLRGTVWSLRSLSADGRPFSVTLRELVERTSAGHDAGTSLAIDPAAENLPPLVSGNLLLVLQEALHNALHHGEPRFVAVEVKADGSGRRIVATVRDDGRGFTMGAQVGPAQGHFGLDGMRERVERLSGTLEIRTAAGAGTTVEAVVPLAPGVAAPPPARPPLARGDLNETPSPDRTMSAGG